jgi:hypothetical protein
VKIFLGQNRSYQLAERADAIAITLDESGGQPNATWRLDVYVESDEGTSYLGTVNTVAASNSPVCPARVIAYAVCPGARSWRIESFGTSTTGGIEPVVVNSVAELRAQPVGCGGCAWGIVPGVFRPGGRTIFNGNLATATGGDSVAPLASSRTDFTAPINFLGAFGSNETGSTIWIMFFDSASVPPNGTQPTDGLSFNVPAGGSFNVVADAPGIFFINGLTWVASSTPNTLTAIAPGATARVVTKASF